MRNSRKGMYLTGSSENHDLLISETLLYLGRNAMYLGRFWPQETGVAYRDGPLGRKYIAYGVKGGGDISGIVIGGRRVEMEGKTGKAVQQENQIAFEKMIRKFGGIYVLFHSPEEALDLLLKELAK